MFNVLHWHEMEFKKNKHILSEQEDSKLKKKKVKEKCFRSQIISFVIKTLHTCISSWKEYSGSYKLKAHKVKLIASVQCRV